MIRSLLLVVVLAGCAPTDLVCNDLCSAPVDPKNCPEDTACVGTATKGEFRCMPKACAGCPSGKCVFDATTCGESSCEP